MGFASAQLPDKGLLGTNQRRWSQVMPVLRVRRTQKTRHQAGCSSRVKNVQTTFREGTLVIGLKAAVKKLLYISPIFWDSATNVS
jgi:hypothetical protein